MKKLLLLLLAAITLTALASCGGADDTTTAADTAAAPDTTDTQEDTLDKIMIIKDGKTNYNIIYDDGMSLYPVAQDLKIAIFDAYSVNMFPKKASQTEVSEYEILIGQTNRPESAQLQSEIAEDEYGIKLIGNKIVITALLENGIEAAVKEFTRLYVSSSNAGLSIPKDLNVVKKAPTEQINTNGGWEFTSYKASNGITLPYQIYTPANLDKSKEYPVILFMHGLGSVGTTGAHITSEVAQFVKNVTASEKYKDEVIIIAPQHPKGQKWVEVDYKPGTYEFDNTPISKWLAAAKQLLDDKMKTLPIDADRVYGYGNSMGAFATIYMAMTYPELYAAIVPVAGGCDPTEAALIKDVPIWLFHGDADSTVDIVGSKTLYDNLIGMGAADAKMTVFKGVGHATKGCFVAAANTEGLLDWMFSHSK